MLYTVYTSNEGSSMIQYDPILPSHTINMSARRPEDPDNRRPRICTPKSLA